MQKMEIKKAVEAQCLPISLMLIYAFDLVIKLNTGINEYSFVEASTHPISKGKGFGLSFFPAFPSHGKKFEEVKESNELLISRQALVIPLGSSTLNWKAATGGHLLHSRAEPHTEHPAPTQQAWEAPSAGKAAGGQPAWVTSRSQD